jgi:hypothetical protein
MISFFQLAKGVFRDWIISGPDSFGREIVRRKNTS